MAEPRTHYQVSFTSRQAVALFAALVGAIGLAYFLGLMTGLAGTEARQQSAVPPAPTLQAGAVAPAAATEPPFPAPVLGVGARTTGARPTAAAPLRPTDTPAAPATPSIQLFEDRASSEPTRPPVAALRPAPAKPPVKAAEAAGFWVQVDSLSSKEQAEARKRGIAAAGFKAAVFPGAGPKGHVFRVRVGPYATREEAERAREAIVRKAKIANSWIVPPGQ